VRANPRNERSKHVPADNWYLWKYSPTSAIVTGPGNAIVCCEDDEGLPAALLGGCALRGLAFMDSKLCHSPLRLRLAVS
jgi:hypothetical protein